MQQKNNGNISGIIGRLGDLRPIDKKYDVAVSTAGRGGLDVVITDTAKLCIEFLKNNNIGRSSFYALDKATENNNGGNVSYGGMSNIFAPLHSNLPLEMQLGPGGVLTRNEYGHHATVLKCRGPSKDFLKINC